MSRKNRTHGVVSTPGNALEIICADRDEWKRRALAYERQRDQALEDLRINLDVIYEQRSDIKDLQSFRAEVLDTCAAAKPVRCEMCNGVGRAEHVRQDANGAYAGIYLLACTACDAIGWTVP